MDKQLIVETWFEDTPYFREHKDRFQQAFSDLPELPTGFSCLLIGSWGLEAPYIVHALRASRVVCVTAPRDYLVEFETAVIPAANEEDAVEVERCAVDLEINTLPEELGQFDLVLAWEVLEHLCVDPTRLIWDGLKHTRNGGYFSVTTPNALWHYYTTAQIFGDNALGLRIKTKYPIAAEPQPNRIEVSDAHKASVRETSFS